MADYGTDSNVTTDLPRKRSLVSGAPNVGRALLRRLTTPRGGLAEIDDDPNYGFDVRELFQAGFVAGDLDRYKTAISSECEKDPRVQSCAVDLVYSYATQTATITLTVTLTDDGGTFPLVLAVTALTVTLLEAVP